jgi:hypothetical protein
MQGVLLSPVTGKHFIAVWVEWCMRSQSGCNSFHSPDSGSGTFTEEHGRFQTNKKLS